MSATAQALFFLGRTGVFDSPDDDLKPGKASIVWGDEAKPSGFRHWLAALLSDLKKLRQEALARREAGEALVDRAKLRCEPFDYIEAQCAMNARSLSKKF